MAKFKNVSGISYVREETLKNGFSVTFEVALTDFMVNNLDNGIGFNFYAESDKILENVQGSEHSIKYRYIPGEGFKLDV
jgi:hypothetical protein